MEIDGNVSSEHISVSGSLFHFNKGSAFFRFHDKDDGSEQICLFRPNKILINKQKMGASNFQSIEAISKLIAEGDEVGALVVPHIDSKTYTITNARSGAVSKVIPGWYAQAVWKGERPDEVCLVSKDVVSKLPEPEVVIDNVPGVLVHNRLMCWSKPGNSQTFIQFTNPEGKTDLAMVKNPRIFYVDGERAKPDYLKTMSPSGGVDVKFTGIYTPSLKEYVHNEKGNEKDGTMAVETRFKPNWRAKLVWMGVKPSDESVDLDRLDRGFKTKKEKIEFLETIKDCEYMCARLEKIISPTQGILMLKSKGILFNIEDLSIDGQNFSNNDDLSKILEVGENMFTYAKNLPNPVIMDGYEVSSEAAQIWKGKRSSDKSSDENKVEKKKTSIPLPNEATHFKISGEVIEVESPGLGYLTIKSNDYGIEGDIALFSRNRFFMDGRKLRFKDALHDHVGVGDQINCDIVRADPTEAGGEYKWIAVLSWIGDKPAVEEINEINKKIENYRAKVLMFDEWVPGKGLISGILQVMGGSSKIGERAFFNRSEVYVFGASMSKADLAYVLKVNDKVQLELESLPTPKTEFGVEIKYKASLVWVGPTPKMDENVHDFPYHVGNVILPFITKRGFTEEDFRRLIKGNMAPKPKEDSNNNGLTTTLGGASILGSTKSKPLILPPNTIFGKIIELKKPESTSLSGTEHGILQIENGPWEKGRAFFNRNCLYCWGHNCSKADLMYLIMDGDKFCVEVADGTNNKAVPYKVTSAWIGPHPHEKNKESAAMAGNPHFMKWLGEHNLTVDKFRQVIAGESQVRPYFPLLGPQHQAKVAYLFPQNSSKSGSDGGVLKIFGGHPNTKEGRKAPEVLFDRESVYIWNVQIASGDLNYVLQENDKVFVEVADLIGKEKKKWQNKLNNVAIPKFIATLVYIGGGRPKAEKLTEDFSKNSNLIQWLNKRNLDMNKFEQLIEGSLPLKTLPEPNDGEMYSKDYNSSMPGYPGGRLKENSPFTNPSRGPKIGSWGLGGVGGGIGSSGYTQNIKMNAFANPIMRQAEDLTQRTMLLQSPEDPDVTKLIQDDAEAQLALFLSKTLTNAIMMYRQGPLGAQGSLPLPQPIGPPSQGQAQGGKKGPGPIAPPGPHLRGGISRSSRHHDFNEFYADSSLAGRGGGLYGLSEPLLQYNQGSQHPGTGQGPHSTMEPPYKRKYEDW